MKRRHTSVVTIGNTSLGGTNPIRIQSMADVSTMDTDAAVAQALRMAEAGAEYIRFTAQGEREAHNLGLIRSKLREKGCETPLVADIHFNPKAAEVAAVHVEKVRINPGNYVDGVRKFRSTDYTDEEYAAGLQKIRDRFIPFLRLCRKHRTAIRIGVNHGSLSDRIMNRYGDTPEGMVASCMEFLRICKEEHFNDVVLSVKASNTVVMVRTVRLLVRMMEAEDMYYPLHLGVTEAGNDEDGRIKSATGIGALLTDGIGDTIRVSLSEPPEAEIPVARKLVHHIEACREVEFTDMPSTYQGTVTDYTRETKAVEIIGGEHLPVVISCRKPDDLAISTVDRPDYFRVSYNDNDTQSVHESNIYRTGETLKPSHVRLMEVTIADLTPVFIEEIKGQEAVVLILKGFSADGVNEARAAVLRLKEAQSQTPLILHRHYKETDLENLQIKAAADLGVLLIDGIGNGVMITSDGFDASVTDRLAFGILQAARARISRTEYISCPGCGRTLYNLQTTIARIKAATSHLTGLKIGIMGCIVNGPGEMADADYGYVGAGRGRISLYKGKTCVLKNIPEEEAVERLLNLIAENLSIETTAPPTDLNEHPLRRVAKSRLLKP